MKDQQKIDSCYAIEDNKNALSCLKEVVRTAEGTCRPKLVLFTQENCVPCKKERARHQEDIAKGIIQELSIESPEGLEIAHRNKIEYFPALVLLDCNNNLISPSD